MVLYRGKKSNRALFTTPRTEMAKFRSLRELEVTDSHGQPFECIAHLMKGIRVEAKKSKGPRGWRAIVGGGSIDKKRHCGLVRKLLEYMT